MPRLRSVLLAAAAAIGLAALARRRGREWIRRYDADGAVETFSDERLLALAREALRAVRSSA